MKLGVLFSGGKDSAVAAWDLKCKGHSLEYFITMIPKNPESYMFHYPNVEFCKYQAKEAGVPHIERHTHGEKEKELEDLKKAVEEARGIEGLVAGGLASNYQGNRIKAICESLEIEFFAPFWKIDSEKYWRILLDNKFKVMITGVACEGLGKEWLGRVIDEQAFRELKKLSEKHRFHLGFEGGEAETFVLDCPLFKKPLEVADGEVVWNRDSGYYLIKKIKS